MAQTMPKGLNYFCPFLLKFVSDDIGWHWMDARGIHNIRGVPGPAPLVGAKWRGLGPWGALASTTHLQTSVRPNFGALDIIGKIIGKIMGNTYWLWFSDFRAVFMEKAFK